MDERISRGLRSASSFEELAQLETNITARKAMTAEVQQAITIRASELGRTLIVTRTGLDLSDLTAAEEKIVQAVSEYAALMKRQGKDATRTFSQLRDRGFIEAAEHSVARTKPTQGFEALEDADLKALSFEQIIVDHEDEFTPRARWYARRTLGLPNEADKPPARGKTPVQERTEELLLWLRELALESDGKLPTFSNEESAASIGMGDLQRYGRAFGNIQSRVDFACYKLGLPPLGLAADRPFARAWNQEDRNWAYPVASMQAASQSRTWSQSDFDSILTETTQLPGQAHISWRKEIRTFEERVRRWAFELKSDSTSEETNETSPTRRNPDWSRDELILALDLYLRHRKSPPSKESAEVAELSTLLVRIAASSGARGSFRNVNGVYMKMMNFRRHDPQYTTGGKVGLTRGNKLELVIWNEFADNPEKLAEAVSKIAAGIESETAAATGLENAPPYWVFVCNPKKWAIDRFFDRRLERDTWTIRPSDSARFAPGQLGLVRVGVDRRNASERNGQAALEAGIYALCEVESEAFEGAGGGGEFWAEGEERAAGRPTVNLRYLRTYAQSPLTIARLKEEAADISPLVLDGFQGATFPIEERDFRRIVSLLGEDIDNLVPPEDEGNIVLDQLALLEQKFLRASPEVKTRVSKGIERGPIGALVKKANDHKCQLCDALGWNPIGFRKPNGEPYVEAHHVMPVSRKEVGSLSASNIMTLCANHHRQIHYGGVTVAISEKKFVVTLEGGSLSIPRLSLPRH